MAVVAMTKCNWEILFFNDFYDRTMIIITVVIFSVGGNSSNPELAMILVMAVTRCYGLAIISFMAKMLHVDWIKNNYSLVITVVMALFGVELLNFCCIILVCTWRPNHCCFFPCLVLASGEKIKPKAQLIFFVVLATRRREQGKRATTEGEQENGVGANARQASLCKEMGEAQVYIECLAPKHPCSHDPTIGLGD